MANIKAEMSTIERRLGNLEAQITLIANAMKKKRVSELDKGLEDFRKGRIHKYKSIRALVKEVWG